MKEINNSSFLPYVRSYMSHSPLLIKNRIIEDLLLPTCWEKTDASRFIKIVDNNIGLLYNGPGEVIDAAASITDNPIPLDVGIYYYEVEIIDEGEKTNIGIGFCRQDAHLHRLPGWDWNSYGYHGDDGNRFWYGSGIRYGPLFNRGDIIGCGINYLDQTAFYTKNGVHLGTAFNHIKGELYPMIGMRSLSERVLVNFGRKPFLFDINSYAKNIFRDEEKKKVSNDIEIDDEISNELLPAVPVIVEDFV